MTNDKYEAGRAAADQILAVAPEVRDIADANRAFLARAIRYLAGKAEITQFLDIGTGIPAADSTHQVAQGIVPESKIAYADNDHCKPGL